MRWNWLTNYDYRPAFVRNVLVKTLLLFIAINAIYIALEPLPWLSRITFYNTIIPGRDRLPFSQNSDDTYSVSLQRIEGMFASHNINSTTDANQFDVIFIGDSSVWGWLLEPDETLTACLNDGDYRTSDGRALQTHNLGYPVLSTFKDLMILDYALDNHDVDAVVWLTSLQSIFTFEQLRHPITDNNPEHTMELIEKYSLSLDNDTLDDDENLLDRSIIGQRRELADLLRHQTYGVAWTLTGIDHTNPLFYEARVENLQSNEAILGNSDIQPDSELEAFISPDVLAAGIQRSTDTGVPILIVNQPIFRADGIGSDIRYNDYYPRAIYDRYRTFMQTTADASNWRYLDRWDALPNEVFSDTPFHYTTDGACAFAAQLAPDVIALANES